MKKTRKYRSTKPALFSRVKAEERKFRLVDLAMLVLIAFVPDIMISTYMFLSGDHLSANRPSGFQDIFGSVQNLAMIAFMIYLLARQGRKLSDIGCSFSWSDILIAVGLFGAQYLLVAIVNRVAQYGYYIIIGKLPDISPRNIEFVTQNRSLWAVLPLVIGSAYEELLVRGYVMSEIKYLWGRWDLAVILSVLLQLSYHTYQGMGALILCFATFLVFALYYAKSRRLTPVIMAHVFVNVFSLVYWWFFS